MLRLLRLGPVLTRYGGSATAARASAGIALPTTARYIAEKADVLRFKAAVTSGGMAALGGWVSVAVTHEGQIEFSGHMHNSGMDSYDFIVLVVLRTAKLTIAGRWSGSVGGTFSKDNRDENWDETSHNPLVSELFEELRVSTLSTYLSYDSAIENALNDSVGAVIRWIVGAAVVDGWVGLAIFVGAELGSLASTGSLVGGAEFVDQVMWLSGPWGSFFSLLGKAVIEMGTRTRELSQAEYDFAKRVFADTLPPRSDIVVTDNIRANGRAYAWVTANGSMSINLGAAGFDDALAGGRGGGITFIHEMTHIWQFSHTSELWRVLSYLSDLLCSESEEDLYSIAPALKHTRFDELTYEQQAVAVEIFFSAVQSLSGEQGWDPSQESNCLFFEYVWYNVRLGRF